MERRETADEIDAAALAWVARLDRAENAADLDAPLNAWLAADVRRQGAFLRAQAIWAKLDRASQAARHSADQNDRAVRTAWTRRAAVLAPLSVGAIAAAGVAGLWAQQQGHEILTVKGEVRRAPLPDGSTAVLNTDTRVRVAMRRDIRRVRLDEGEAWFQVQKDATRPFEVEAGPIRVRAVGTAFSVRVLPVGAQVLVSEGAVEAWSDLATGNGTRIAAGDIARVRDHGPIQVTVAKNGEIDRRLAWRAGKIDLAGETLAEAIAEFNRYNVRQMYLAQKNLSSKRFYGVFRMDDPVGFAQTVRLTMNTRVDISPNRITIGL